MWRILSGLGMGLAVAAFAAAAADAADAPSREQSVAVQVQVNAAGKVTAAQPVPDPAVAAAMSRVAGELAYKLPFTPARKDGVAVASETVLFLWLAVEPRGDGQFAIRLRQASNGPLVTDMGRIVVPRYQERGDRGASIVVGISISAEGVPDMESFRAESVRLRSPSKFAEARYLDAITASLRQTRFRVDKVDGAAIATHVRLPYLFGGGAGKRDERTGELLDKTLPPGVEERSGQPGVELPSVLFSPPPG